MGGILCDKNLGKAKLFVYQTSQLFPGRTMAALALQLKALRKSSEFDTGPMTRNL
jgi:hypothetical protein